MIDRAEFSCGVCGRHMRSATSHDEAWRDKGHAPRAIRELEPHKEIALRIAMTRPTGRDAR